MYVETRIFDVFRLSRDHRLGICEASVGVVGASMKDVVFGIVPDLLPHAVGEAEAPPRLPVRRSRRDRFGPVGDRPEMVLQLGTAESGVDGLAVAENVQRMIAQVDQAAAVGGGDPAVIDIPLGRDVKSKTWIPLGTSVKSSGTTASSNRSVARTPSPVRLRGNGKSPSARDIASAPRTSGAGNPRSAIPYKSATVVVTARSEACGKRTPRRTAHPR